MSLVRADALSLPLADESVDLIVTSPPYFALRSYTDGGEHYDGQIGSEDTPRAFLEALWAVTRECKRVLKPTGSMFVNLGDKYAGSGGHNNAGLSTAGSTLQGSKQQDRTGLSAKERRAEREARVGGGGGARRDAALRASRRQAPDRYNQSGDVPRKSLMGLPWLYALGCTGALAGLGGADPNLNLTLRAEIIWSKPNGLPESVNDRVRRSHEQWFHLTKSPTYYAALDEIREPHAPGTAERYAAGYGDRSTTNGERQSTGYDLGGEWTLNAKGKLPGSVRTVSTEPLRVPEDLDVDHFAAFPTEWPRWFINGWSPSGICIECSEPRRPVAAVASIDDRRGRAQGRDGDSLNRIPGRNPDGRNGERYSAAVAVTGYACACPDDSAPTRPAVVLDPFGGTGTTAMVANALGRYGISVDLSADYLRLARWRIHESGHARKAIARTWQERQGALL